MTSAFPPVTRSSAQTSNSSSLSTFFSISSSSAASSSSSSGMEGGSTPARRMMTLRRLADAVGTAAVVISSPFSESWTDLRRCARAGRAWELSNCDEMYSPTFLFRMSLGCDDNLAFVVPLAAFSREGFFASAVALRSATATCCSASRCSSAFTSPFSRSPITCSAYDSASLGLLGGASTLLFVRGAADISVNPSPVGVPQSCFGMQFPMVVFVVPLSLFLSLASQTTPF
mmetsp:Transcript_14111/g.35382  ORF Transcript_14111/g.35382 Transcript_14111/m.35382 type:complete len:230 (-) Transcript_14111:2-691(-)